MLQGAKEVRTSQPRYPEPPTPWLHDSDVELVAQSKRDEDLQPEARARPPFVPGKRQFSDGQFLQLCSS